MKRRPVTNIDNRNTATSKKFDDDAISANCGVIVVFPIYVRFGAIRKPDSGCMIFKTYIFTKSNLLSHKN